METKGISIDVHVVSLAYVVRVQSSHTLAPSEVVHNVVVLELAWLTRNNNMIVFLVSTDGMI